MKKCMKKCFIILLAAMSLALCGCNKVVVEIKPIDETSTNAPDTPAMPLATANAVSTSVTLSPENNMSGAQEPSCITPISNQTMSPVKPVSTSKPVSDSPKPGTTASYKDTMSDYSKCGMKQAGARVASSDYISIADYGVNANTTVDVSQKVQQAIQDANSKGKYLYFPEGTYYINKVRITDKNDVKICGCGEKSILKTAPTANRNNWDVALTINNSSNIIVRDLVFDGNNQSVYGDPACGVIQLRLENTKSATVFGCRFQNNNSGNINIVGEGKNIQIYYCDFLNSDCGIISGAGYINGGFICNNFFDGQQWQYSEAISIYNAAGLGVNKDIVISGNDVRNHPAAAAGIFITYPSENITIEHNYIYKCGSGIGCGSALQSKSSTQGPAGVIVKNNTIDSPTWHGFLLQYADAWTISDNTLKNIGNGYGMLLQQCKNLNIGTNNLNGARIQYEN